MWTPWPSASPTASFDWACSSHLIEHFDDPEGHVRELARVLGDGGTAFFSRPTPRRLREPVPRPPVRAAGLRPCSTALHGGHGPGDGCRPAREGQLHGPAGEGPEGPPARRVRPPAPDPPEVVHRRLHPDPPAGLPGHRPGESGGAHGDHR